MENQIEKLNQKIEALTEAVEKLEDTIATVFAPADGYPVNLTIADLLSNLVYEIKKLNEEGQ